MGTVYDAQTAEMRWPDSSPIDDLPEYNGRWAAVMSTTLNSAPPTHAETYKRRTETGGYTTKSVCMYMCAERVADDGKELEIIF